jgi:hypothetical protein
MHKKSKSARNSVVASQELAGVESKISRIQALKPPEVRALWRTTFGSEAPKAFTRDLMVRAICWRVQVDAFGGHSPAMLKLLASYANGRPQYSRRLQRLKPGTELVREYQGERHTVIISRQGFRWRGQDYASLTAIARAITNSNWNGPRFFGLREDQDGQGKASGAAGSLARGQAGLGTIGGHTRA